MLGWNFFWWIKSQWWIVSSDDYVHDHWTIIIWAPYSFYHSVFSPRNFQWKKQSIWLQVICVTRLFLLHLHIIYILSCVELNKMEITWTLKSLPKLLGWKFLSASLENVFFFFFLGSNFSWRRPILRDPIFCHRILKTLQSELTT